MLTMKWRVIVARTLILVMAGNPVIFAAHGMERTANEHLVKQAAEQREMARLRQQLAAAQVSAAQTVAQAAAPVSTGVSLANGQQAGIKTSANGTTVIDIAAPSQRGVSHNRFNQFNVPTEGLILNNSKDPLISVLGGWTDGNRRLSGGTAGLILAEVTGTGRSSLLGYTEVLGDAAEFVLANPNGITCNGCGFINTPRVVLATGIPELLNGELAGINISGGDVRIEGAGLNAANVSKFDILTRAMQLNAALYADELNIRTGSNYYDFRTGEVQANADQAAGSSAYQFALDASALGAMYANSISLIGTEKGLGVRSDGLINSVDSLQLTADGQLQLKDTVAGGNLTLGSQQADIITSGTTYGQNVSIELAGTLHNSGVIAAADTMQVVASGMQQGGDLIAGVNLQGEWQQTAAQQLNISGDLVNQGRIISQGQQTLAAARLQNDAGALVQGDIANISSLSLANQGIINSTSLALATNSAQSSGHIQAQQLNINARQFNLLDGMIYQSGADGRFNFSGENLLLAGGLLAADGATKVNVAGEIQNNTNWLAAGNASISATNIINSGTLQLLAGADVTADTLNNSGNMLFAGEQAAALNISKTLDNQAGLLQFSSNAMLSGATINNDGGQIYHLGQGDLSLKAAGQLSNRSGEILSNGSMQLSAAQIENQQGTLSAEQLALSATNINSQAGNIQAGLLDITAQQLNNQQGSIAALGGSGQSLQLNITDTLDNSQGFILAKGQQLSLSTKQLINDQGSLLLSGADGLTINASGQLRNQQGLIHSGGGLLLNTPLLNNNQGEISARDINISAATLNNRQGVIGAQQVTLDGAYLDNRAGNIGAFSAAGHNLTLNFSQAIDNSAQGIIQSAADVAVITSRQLNNTDGNIVLAGSNGSLQVSATTLQNQQGQIQTNGQLLLTADNVQNQAGYIAALGDVSINATSVNNSAGQILADKLLLNTAQLTNTDGMILVQNELNLHSPLLANLRGIISAQTLNITGNTLDNTGGQLLAAEDLNISTGQLTNLDGVINSQQTLQLSAAELNNRSGVIQGVNSFHAQVQGSTDNHSGQLLAGANLQLHSGLLDNTQGTVAAGGQLNIDTTELQNSEAGVISGTALNITATTLRNEAQARIEGQQLQLTSRVIDNAGTLLAAGQQGDSLVLLTDVLNNQGRIESHGENLSLTNVQLNNQQGQIYHLGTGVLQLEFLAELNNSSGEMYSAGRLNIHGGNINNSNGSLIAQQALLLNAAQLDNSEGAIQTSGSLNLQATALNNQQGLLLAATDMQVTVQQLDNTEGQLLNLGSGLLHIDSQQVLTNDHGTIYSAGNLAIQTETMANRSGELQAQAISLSSNQLDNRSGQILSLAQQGSSLSVAVTEQLDNRAGVVYSAGGEAVISADSLLNTAGNVVHAGSGRLLVTAQSIANGADGVIASNDALWLEAQQLESAGQLSAQELHIQADTLVNSGAIEAANLQLRANNTNSSGLIAAQQQLMLNGTALTNSGTIFSEGNLTLTSDRVTNSGTVAQSGIGVLHLDVLDSLNNQLGQIISEGALLLAAGTVNNNQGLIQAGQADITVTALNNNNGRLFSDQLQIQAANLSNNAGLIVANDSLLLQVDQTLDNSRGELIITGGNASITADILNNDDGIISQLAESLQLNSGVITNNGGTLHSAQQLNINAAQFDNSGLVDAATLMVVSDSLTNSGTIQAENARLSSTQLVNDGLLLATGTVGESLQLDVANGIVNRGHIQSHGQNLLLRDALDNDAGTLVHAGNGELQLAQLSNRQGTVYAGNALTIAGKVLNREGILQAQGTVNISGAELDNRSGVIRNGGNLLLDVTALDNRDGELSTEGELAQLQVAGSILNASGIIVSAGSQLDVHSAEVVLADGVIAGHGLVNINAGQLNVSEGGQISAGQTLALNADTLSNQGLLSGQNVLVQASVLDNQSGVIEAASSLQVAAGYVNNIAGTLVSQGELSLDLQGQQDGIALNNNEGKIIATGALALVTPYAVTNTAGQLLSEQQLQIQAGALNNSSGEILAGNGLAVNLNAALDNSGGVLYSRQGDLTLTAQSLLNDAGGLILQHGTGQMQLTLDTLHNSGEIGAGTVLAVTAQQLTNSGLIQAASVELAAQQLRNSGNLLGDNLFISADQLNNTDGTIAALASDSVLQINAAALNNQRGLIQSRGNTLQLNTVLNNQQGDVVLLGNGTLNISALANNQQGRILSEGAVALAGVVNNNQGIVQAATDLQLAGTDISNIAGVIHAGGALNISGTSLINQGGKISAAGQSYQLAISGAIDNSLDGILTTAGNMAITAAGLNNTSGLIYQQGDGSLLLQVDNTLNNNDGTIAATDLAITADRLNNNTGLIQGGAVDISTALLNNNAGTIYQQGSAGQLNISTGSLTNDAGQISALADANISAGQLSNNAGRIESGSALHLSGGALNNDSGNLVANNITMQLTGALSNNQGTLFAADTLTIAADSIDNTLGTLAANADIQLTVATALTNNQGLLQAAGNLVASAQQIDNSAGTIQATAAQLNARQSINNAAGVINAQTLALSTAALNNSYGVILATDTSDNSLQLTEVSQLNNSNGTLASHGRNWDFTLAGLNNDNGKLLHLGTGTFTLSQAGNLANTGTIASNANLVINAGNVSNSGTLQAQQQLQLNSALANQAGAVLVANNITLNAAGNSITNAGSISAANNLQLDAASVTNSHLLYAGNNALVNAANVSNSGTWSANNLNVSGFNLLQNSGRIESNTATYTGNTLQNQASGVLINAATAANSLQLNVAQLSNSGTLYNNARDMSLGGNLSNSGSIIHAGTGNLLLGNNGSINNAGGSIASAGTATMQNSIIGAGTVYAEQGMLINGSGTFTNNSQLYTKGNMQVNSALHNQGGSLLSDGNLTINTAGSVTNSGSLQGQNLSLTSGVLNNNGGVITSTGTNNAQISAASLSNNGGVIQATNNNFTISTRSGELNNSNGQIKHGGNGVLTLQSASHLNQQSGLVQSAGQLVATAQGNLDNSYGVLSASQYQLTSSGTLNNNNGQVIATSSGTGSGSSSIQSGTLLNRSGHIAANGTNLTLNTAALDNNNGSILLAGSGNLAITASSVTNDAANSRIISNGGISLNSGSALNNAGVISAANLLTLTGTNLTNSGTLASRSGKVDIDSSGTLTNSGIISGATAVDLDVRTLNNASGTVQSDGTVAVTVNSLSVGQIYGRDLLLSSNNSIALQNGELLSASRNLQLNSNGNITNSGNIIASGMLNVDATELTNNATGVIRSGGNAVLDLNRLTNNGIVSSNAVLTLNAANTTNTGTLAAGNHLDINGNIDNSNLLFAGSLLTIDGNVSNTANIYSNQDAVISGATVTNTGGTIAAAQDLSISGTILNDFVGTLSYTEGEVTRWKRYPNVDDPRDYILGHYYGWGQNLWIYAESVTTQHYEAKLTGKVGVIAAGRDLSLDGDITNNYSAISAGQDISLTGTRLKNNSATNKQVNTVTVTQEEWDDGCMQYFMGDNGPAGCAEPGYSTPTGQVMSVGSYEETTYTGGVYGSIVAGRNIYGNLTEDVTLGDVSPVASNTPTTIANGSSGSASRGSNAGASNSSNVTVNRNNGTSQNTSGANRSANGVTAGNSGTVDAEWRDSNVNHTGVQPGSQPDNVGIGQVVGTTARQINTLDAAGQIIVSNAELQGQQQQAGQVGSATLQSKQQAGLNTDVSGADAVQLVVNPDAGTAADIAVSNPTQQITAVSSDNRQLNAGDLLHKGGTDTGPAQLVATQGDVRNVQVTDPARQQADALQTGIGVQGIGFMSPDMAASLRVSQGSAPQGPGQQQGGGLVGNGNIAGSGDYNPDLIIKGLVDNQQGTLAQQKNSAQQQSATQAATQGNSTTGYSTGQQVGQNVFITDEQMRVLTEDLGFDANAINKGQQALYAAISQNDLLADGVTLSAGGTIDITADAGFNINSGIAAGEGLILRSEGGLNMGNFGFFDSENLLGLQLGGDFTNNINLQSNTLWLDISGDFTNLGSLTGNNVLSISAGNNLINQNLLSGGHVLLNAGGDIINRTEFSQHTVEFANGNSKTYTTVGNAPQIISNDSLSMTAGNNIDLQGSKFSAAGDISLNAGNDVLLGAVEKLSGHETYFKGGHDIELHRTYDVVSFDAGGNLSVVAGNNLQSEGAVFAAAGDVELAAGNEMNLLGVVEYHEDREQRTKKSTFKKTVYIDETYSAEHQGSVIVAGGNVSLNAQQGADGLQLLNSGNVLLEGTYIQAGGNMVAYSGGELNIVSGEEWQAENHVKKKSMFGGLFGSTKISETDVQYLGHAELNAGGDMVLLAQNDINVLAGRINADNIVAQAGFGNEGAKAADINILGDTETTSLYQETRRNGLALGFSDNFLSVAKETANENRTIQTDYVGSVFTAKDNMALTASRDVNIVGSELHAGGNLLLDAGRDINVLTGQGSGSSYSRQTETKTGIAISADRNTLSVFAGDDTQKDALTSNSTTQTGSVLTANNVQLNAGNDLLISGSDIAAVNDIRLSAVKDISIVTAQELFNQQTEHSHIRDGLTVSANYNIGNTVDAISNLGQGGDAVSVASSVMQAADTLNNAGPSASAHLGQTTTTTTNTVQQGVAKGSSLTAGGNVTVNAGGDALFEGAQVNATGNINVDAENISVIAAQNSSGSKHNTEYLQVGLSLNASTTNVSLTAGFSQSDSELNNQNTDAMGSSLNAGGNVNLNARNDLAIIGSDINGDDSVALTAGNDIIIKAAESQFSSNSQDSHLSAGAGANFGSNGVGFTANMAMGEGELDREGTTYSNSHITAGKTLTVKSGNDTTIAGGNLAATDVDMDIGGNLTVASVQNTSQVEGSRWDVSANITVGAGASGGASAGYGETEGSSAWVNEQSSIIGSGSVNIRTEGHTQIDGAVIANIDENGNDLGNLTLDTGSLAYTDIADHDKEKSYYLNVGFTMGDDTNTNQTESGNNYNASGNYSNHDKEQINRATVGEGNIIVRDNPQQDLSDLNRDTNIAQEVTKDDSKDVNLYASTTALDSLGNLVENPEQQLNKWKDNVASVGSTEAWGQVVDNVENAAYVALLVATDAVTVEEFNNNVARQKTLRKSILTLTDTEASPEERKDAVEGYIFNALPWNEDSPDAIAARDAIANEIGQLMLTDPAKAEQALGMLGSVMQPGQADALQTDFLPVVLGLPELLVFLGVGTAVVAGTEEGRQAASDAAKGIGSLFGKDAAPAWSESEVFGKTLTEPFDIFNMLEVGQAYQMADGRIVVKSNSTYMTMSDAGSDLGGLQMVSAEQLGQQGGYQAGERISSNTETTAQGGLSSNTGTIAQGGLSSNTETTAQGGLSSNTGTPVQEGHLGDTVYLSENGNDVEKIYSASGQSELRETRRPAFDTWRAEGIPGTDYTLNPHAYNSLFKSGRKDIMPDDVLDALSSSSMPGEQGSLKFVNPVTGTRVFVNPETKQVVGIQPGDFGD
ncbi:hemagglutinin repeat-containing protein [Rheinheimera oceanensis]|uniref:hemagglutinin repeat-containing protein n=1 Tax=Rheinheimera oceanensis TaxID=2817449 RepID=UPI001BFD448C|nr:hemagglutinin repeat-containing protein [Rheinheimera oceanensis]